MKLLIARDPKNNLITTIKEFQDINDSGEIAHFITELEIIKLELIELWEEYHENQTDT